MESIPVEMRRKIMGHLSNADLIKISRVNKLLNFEARSLMKDRKSLIARVRSRHWPRDAASFVSDLGKMIIVPFSGANIELHSHCQMDRNGKMHHDESALTRELGSSFDMNLDRMLWRRLSLIFSGCHIAKTSTSLHLVQKVLEKHCDTLEEFSLTIHLNLLQPIQQLVQQCRFPRMKILRLEGSDWEIYTRCDPEPFIKAVAQRAPNLEWVQIERPKYYSENLLQGTSAVFVASRLFNPINYNMSASVARTVRLRRLQLSYKADRMSIPFSVKRFNKTIPMILQTSFTTLNYLRIDLVLAVLLMCLGIRLINVRHMDILVDYAYLEQITQSQQFISILKRFDFTRMFPSLRQLHISTLPSFITPDQINEIIEQGNADLMEPEPDRALNIKNLLFHEVLKEEIVPLLAAMCPDVGKITICTGLPFNEQIFREQWRDLKEFVVETEGGDKYAWRNEDPDDY